MNGIIYKIYHKDNEDLFYIGSTTDLDRRKREHKYNCANRNSRHHNSKLYQIIRENGSWECFQFDIIEQVCCETQEDLFKKEDEYITTLKPNMNSQKAFVAETREEYKKQYYVDNKEKIVERSNKRYCDNIEQIKEYQKQYYIDNKEKIIENGKKYYSDNREKCKEYSKEYNKNYRTDNKERISGYLRKKIKCECGCEVSSRNISAHKKTKKHLNLIQQLGSHNE